MATNVARVVTFFETLTPDSVAGIGQIYDGQARFKDPFNDVTGVPAIKRIFDPMFASLHEPRFVVTQQVVQGDQCFLTWEFHFRFRTYRPAQHQIILGASHLVFASTGLVTLHRDYWDAAEELYEKLPLLGSAMRWLKRRANH
ncbi:MAG: nuclear transport factor 2 family protein [Betaproteobacteria bacterium]|nr:nuclear transport factor 2 family protein [Betaproteobacteria bacterium]